MTTLSLVNQAEIEKDPSKLLYHYPSIPKMRYAKMVDKYYRALAIRAAEDAAKANQCLLVPARCINYKRKDLSKRVIIYGKSYYIMSIDDMTEIEIQKYRIVCEEVSEIAI